MKNTLASLVTLFSLFVSISNPTLVVAQTSPLSLPLFDGSTITYKGSWTFDDQDGAGGWLSHGGEAFGVSEDGQYVYVACQMGLPQKGIAKLRIPALGSEATVVSPCQGPNNTEIDKILPGVWDAGQRTLGGVLEQGGRVVVSAYGSYDANGTAIASHWSGPSLTQLSGPFRGTVSPGLVKSYMGPIPVEWRSLLGGSAFAMSGYTSIISRQSTGATFTVFNPANVTANNFPMKMLLGCPFQESPICQTWTNWGPSSNNFEGAELAAGGFIIPGTRTFAAIEREANGTVPAGGSVPYEGYGYPTNNLSLHGQPYPSPEGVKYIYSLSDPNTKGNKGYPYRLVAKLYDLADLVAVNQGTKNYVNIKQYATVNMPNSSDSEFVSGGAFNPVTGDYYLIRSFAPNAAGKMTVYVYGGFGSSGTTSGSDITAPSVSVAAPFSGSTVADTVTISANASDNVAIAGVQFKVDGVNFGAEDTTAPYAVSWDSKSASNGSHTITAVARDTSFNTTTSSVVSVTVNNIVPPTPPPPPPVINPVGHWKLDESSGTIATDASGNGNNGTLLGGGSFTSGKLSNALMFDGLDDYINIGNPSNLIPSSGITMSAWTRFDRNDVSQMVVSKDDAVNPNPTFIRLQGGGDVRCLVGGTSVTTSGLALATNTWHHVACTYDGSNVNVYVNGVARGTTIKTGSIVDVSGVNWNIGRRLNSMYMDGAIDDVRIYNRGLTSSEISTLYNSTGSTGGDTTKPTVNITAPSSYTAIKGVPILVSADATDNIGVVGVQFKLDGVNLGTEDTTSPYSTIWDTTNATEGAHTLTAVARDAAGNTQTSASVTVTIPSADTTDTTKPTVSISSPASGSTLSGTVNLSVNATDDVGVAGVQFKLNGSDLLSEDSTAPYSLTWNTDSVSDGSYTLTAVARDAAGNTQTSSSVSITVSNGVEDEPVVPPTVSITTPSAGSTLSDVVTVSANATDNVGVSGVQFKLDGVNLLPEDTTAPYSISWDTKTATNGTHTLTAIAKDTEGNQTTSSSVSVTVKNDSDVPTGLKIGDKVKTTAWVNVRSTAGGRWVGSQRTGRTGTITAGPGYANSLTWWRVNFTSGADGWVASNYLTKTTVAMTEDDYRKNIANIYLLIKYLQERIAGQN